jgi:cholesterol oxidase
VSDQEAALGQEFDVVVIGSGFGGAAVAARLAWAGKSVAILERGKRYPPGRTDVTTTGHGLRRRRFGHFQVDQGKGMNVIRGIGVGGGSLHYFGVRLRADPRIFDHDRFPGNRWPAEISRQVLDPYYDLAGDMLPAGPLAPHPVLGLPTRSTAFMDAAHNCRRCRKEPKLVPIAVHSAAEPAATHVPGVYQTRCVYCGECLIGCPPSESFEGDVNARALLTLNYLAWAEEHGARIFPEHFVDRIAKVAEGFEVEVSLRDPDADETDPRGVREQGSVRARKVVLGAGTLGSTEILLKSRQTLPPLSRQLGLHFSGNGDFLIPKTKNAVQDLQPKSGPLITVGADFGTEDNDIFIEDLGKIPFASAILGTQQETTFELFERQLGYLGMGTDASNGVLSLEDGAVLLHWDPTDSLPLYGEIVAALREMSQNLGGNYADPENYNPFTGTGLLTAHPLGGCVMGDSPETGVVDPRGEVFGVPGLYVADGATLCTAIATNPSYTISAVAERIAFWMLHGREMRDGDPDTPANR